MPALIRSRSQDIAKMTVNMGKGVGVAVGMGVDAAARGVGAAARTVLERVEVLPPLHKGAFREACTYADLLHALRDIGYLEAEQDRMALVEHVDGVGAWDFDGLGAHSDSDGSDA